MRGQIVPAMLSLERLYLTTIQGASMSYMHKEGTALVSTIVPRLPRASSLVCTYTSSRPTAPLLVVCSHCDAIGKTDCLSNGSAHGNATGDTTSNANSNADSNANTSWYTYAHACTHVRPYPRYSTGNHMCPSSSTVGLHPAFLKISIDVSTGLE